MPGDCTVHLRAELTIGPVFNTCLDVLKLGRELFELIPEWHEAERRTLELHLIALADQVETGLRIGK